MYRVNIGFTLIKVANQTLFVLPLHIYSNYIFLNSKETNYTTLNIADSLHNAYV